MGPAVQLMVEKHHCVIISVTFVRFAALMQSEIPVKTLLQESLFGIHSSLSFSLSPSCHRSCLPPLSLSPLLSPPELKDRLSAPSDLSLLFFSFLAPSLVLTTPPPLHTHTQAHTCTGTQTPTLPVCGDNGEETKERKEAAEPRRLVGSQ